MGMRPAMQVKVGGDRERRAFNPDRDLVWSMGRHVKRLGAKLSKLIHNEDGTINPDEYVKVLQRHGIYAMATHKDELVGRFVEFITAVNDYFQALHGDMEKNEISKPLPVMYSGDQYGAARALFSVLLMQEIFAEHPFWWAQVKPQSLVDPQPDVKTIDAAVRELLGQLAG